MKFMLTLVTSAALAITSSLSPNINYQAAQKDQTLLLSNNIVTQTEVKTPLVNTSSLLTISGTTATISETYNNVPVTYVNLPKTVFNNSHIEELVLPSGLSRILSEDYIEKEESMVQNFNSITPNCPNLSKVTLSSNNTNFKSIDGVLYSKDGTILYYCPPAKTGDLVIPEGVTTIEFFAFQNCSKLTSISIPSTTKNIYRAAFGGNTSLKTIKVADSNPYLKAVSNVLFSAD